MSPQLSKKEAAIFAAIDPPFLPPGTQVIRREGWYQVVNPLIKDGSSNEVMLSYLEDREIERRVEEAREIYRKNTSPFKWSIGPMSSPDRLEKVLAGLAAESWDYRGMSIDTDAGIGLREGISVERVNEASFQDFLEVNLAGWNLRSFAAGVREKLHTVATHPMARSFIARKNGSAIGSAATIIREGYGLLVGAVVLAEARGSGAYRALVHARLSDLAREGIPFAVTQARGSTSAPILEKLGFQTEYDARIYRFDP